MQQDYKDISELKTDVAVVKERQRIIDERLSEIIEANKNFSSELKKMYEDNANPRKEFITIIVRSSAMVIASLMATIITMLIMFKK
jgi:hypothetical protein